MGYRLDRFTSSIWRQLVAALVYGFVVAVILSVDIITNFSFEFLRDELSGIIGTGLMFAYPLLLLPFLAFLLGKLHFFNRHAGILTAWTLGAGSGLMFAIFMAIKATAEPAAGWAILLIIPLAPIATGLGLILGGLTKKREIDR
ncbi:MAG: hypothetical protein WD061_02350 [Candidatus Saccharimonadales bacterium]